jgi:3',5'-cyclic AMP phosphodiesterase CpdA
MKTLFENIIKCFCIVLFVLLLFNSCYFDTKPCTKIMVISDVHYFDPDLLVQDGVAFQTYLAQDRKLLKESEAILDSAIDAIDLENPEIVLICGDLTKDGELSGHMKVAQKLHMLKKQGKKIFVIPGNHDINNPHALSFNGDSVSPVPSITPIQFSNIYKDFGFKQALSRDPGSLSYVIEPVPGLRIIAMDSCKYSTNYTQGSPETSGAFSDATLKWIECEIKKATKLGKTVFGFMHHGLLEHFTVQKLLFGEYIIDNNDLIAGKFAELGMKIVLTGHYHSQDMAKTPTVNGKFVFDIETGSLVTSPCPYRILDLDDDILSVTSEKITAIDYPIPFGSNFQEYAHLYLYDGMEDLVYYMLTNGLISVGGYPVIVPPVQAAAVAPILAAAFVANYAGDETPNEVIMGIIQNFLLGDQTMQIPGNALGALWIDPMLPDNNLVIDLNDGSLL